MRRVIKQKNSFSKINPKNSHTTEFMKSVGLNDTILHRTEDQGPNAMHRNGVSWNWNVKIRRQRRYGFMSQLAGGVAISSNSLRWHLHKLCSVHLDASASLAQLRLDLSYRPTLVFSVSVVKQLNLQSDIGPITCFTNDLHCTFLQELEICIGRACHQRAVMCTCTLVLVLEV